jgi:transcriptional regulator with XRE-family HTH domain
VADGSKLWLLVKNSRLEEVRVSVRVNGEKLREAREDALLSQRELGELAGVSPDTILRIEGGEGGAYGRTIRRIAGALNMDYHVLLVETDQGKALAR